jgi:hypothetical protein
MPLYNFTIRLMDTGLPYPNLEEAKESCEEWANEIAQTENCTVVDFDVMEASN